MNDCWICGHAEVSSVRPSSLETDPESDDFRITNAQYGRTAEIFRCAACGFLQCSRLGNPLSFYEDLVDEEYENTRAERSLQERSILRLVRKWHISGRLLDVGAGSGILVEQALALGFDARGVEPSDWLCARARERSLPVTQGVFPHAEIQGPFDVITLVDVIEHVNHPVELLREIRAALAPGGVAIVVTPDVQSAAARVMGWRWWHFRVAHVGYFDRNTLSLAAQHAGLKILNWRRPGWYFSAEYLATRLLSYLPFRAPVPAKRLLRRITVPLNLFDSWLVVVVPDQS